MTLTDTSAPAGRTAATWPPLDQDTTHALLFRAAAACEDDAITALECARELNNPDAIARCTAERNTFDRLCVALRANAIPAGPDRTAA